MAECSRQTVSNTFMVCEERIQYYNYIIIVSDNMTF